MRQFFKTIKVHHCYNFEACEPKPKTCKCRKFIAKSFAEDLVADGVADWVISYPIGTTIYDAIILKGIAGKTPRAQTIEKAHIERYIGISGDPDNPEDKERLEAYHDIEVTERLKLFHNIGIDLIYKKQESDSFGVLVGEAGKVLHDKFINEVEEMKANNTIDDPFIGEAIFMSLGGDQRTVVGKDVLIGQEKLDKG